MLCYWIRWLPGSSGGGDWSNLPSPYVTAINFKSSAPLLYYYDMLYYVYLSIYLSIYLYIYRERER